MHKEVEQRVQQEVEQQVQKEVEQRLEEKVRHMRQEMEASQKLFEQQMMERVSAMLASHTG